MAVTPNWFCTSKPRRAFIYLLDTLSWKQQQNKLKVSETANGKHCPTIVFRKWTKAATTIIMLWSFMNAIICSGRISFYFSRGKERHRISQEFSCENRKVRTKVALNSLCSIEWTFLTSYMKKPLPSSDSARGKSKLWYTILQ